MKRRYYIVLLFLALLWLPVVACTKPPEPPKPPMTVVVVQPAPKPVPLPVKRPEVHKKRTHHRE